MKPFLATFLASFLLVGAGCSSPETPSTYSSTDGTEEHPNIILVITDDQGANFFTAETMPKTYALAMKSANFTKAYTTTPLCCPSRSSILTGQYAHNHGVHTNRAPDGGFTVFEDEQTVPVWLHQAGYETALFGKYLNGYGKKGGNVYVPPGWDTFEALMDVMSEDASLYEDYALSNHKDGVTNGTTSYGDGEDDYLTDVLRREAVGFINGMEKEDEKSFFVYFAPFAPHAPAIPADAYKNALTDFSFEQAPSYNEADVSDKTGGVQDTVLLAGQQLRQTDRLPRLMAQSLLSVDDAIAEMMDTLQKNGEADNTVLLFVGDNGLLLGEHRLFGKANPYEEAIHVPLFISDPAQTTGSTFENLVLNIDLAPTILSYAGVTIPSSVDGRSVRGIIEGQENAWRTEFIDEAWGTENVGPYVALHSKDAVYIEFAMENGIAVEYYDLVKDPYQLTNAAADPAYAEEIAAMKNRLDELKNCAGNSCP